MEILGYSTKKNMTKSSNRNYVYDIITATFIFIAIVFYPNSLHSKIITTLQIPRSEKIVALTFDACETRTPAFFDLKILDYLLRNKIPFTLFISGKFAKRTVNAMILRELSRYNFVEIENHSFNHYQHMEKLPDRKITDEVKRTEAIIFRITGRKTKFFRFPAGNCNAHSVKLVESLGYKVVHWTFASGDPDRNISPKQLIRWVLRNVTPDSILIFHINGRGYSTSRALPVIMKVLRNRGYRFVKLEDGLR